MIRIVEGKIDQAEAERSVAADEAGAVVTFDGVVRNHARGKAVTHLFYETYRAMALQEMERLRRQAMEKWPLKGAAIVHRVGRLEVGESSVFIAVSSAHRAAAFEACRWIIDALKTTVPIWKREHYRDGEAWIEEYGG